MDIKHNKTMDLGSKQKYLLSQLKKLCNELDRKPTYTEIDKCNYTPSTHLKSKTLLL